MLAVRRTDFNVKDHARTSQRFAAWSLNEMGTCLEEELYDFQVFCNCRSSSSMHYSLVIMVTKLRPSSTGLHGVSTQSRAFDPPCLYET